MQHNLVFLPGWEFRASVFSVIAPYFSQHHLHYKDLPTMAGDKINDILQAFSADIPEDSILIGWSLGGMIAIQLCVQFPHKFKKLVLLSSVPKLNKAQDWDDKFLKLVCFPSVNRSLRYYLDEHKEQKSHEEKRRANLNYLFESDLRKEYSNLTLPILSISGDRDAIAPVSEASHCIPGAGHAMFFTHTAEVCAYINQFIDDAT